MILLEFSINGTRGLHPIDQGILRRYPNSIIIYVNILSLTHVKGRKKVGGSIPNDVMVAMKDAEGILYWFEEGLPTDYPNHDVPALLRSSLAVRGSDKGKNELDTMRMYLPDLQRLRKEGHAAVVRVLMSILLGDEDNGKINVEAEEGDQAEEDKIRT